MKTSPPNSSGIVISNDNSTDNRIQFSYKLPIEKIIFLTCIITSLAVIYAWILGYEKILSIIPGSPTMKFNTALVFLFAGINLIFFNNKEKHYKALFNVLSVAIIIIGAFSLAAFFGADAYQFSNFIVHDTFSTINPGLMSPATSLCSLLLGFAFLGLKSESVKMNAIGSKLILAILIVSLLSILSYILLIPVENKSSLLQTMAIHTSVLFFSISVIFRIKAPNSITRNMLTGNLAGSKIFRQLLPKIIIFPILLGNILLIVLHQNIINTDFGIVAYTLILILLSILYISHLAYGLNQTENERNKLELDVFAKNKNSKKFKEAVDRISLVSFTDNKGVINYVNDAFCQLSQYSESELIGNTHQILSSKHHSPEFIKNLWQTINNGNVWVGNIKNKAKDGSYFWVQASIVPFKNENGEITEFVSINRNITECKERADA